MIPSRRHLMTKRAISSESTMTDQHETVLFGGTLPVAWRDMGEGLPVLLLHGGAGPGSMMDLASGLAELGHRAVVPTYPAFDGRPRPDWFHRIDDLALMVLVLIEHLELMCVTVVGNSVGGWLAIETGLRASPRVSRLILLNAVGLDPTPEGGGIVDPATLGAQELPFYAFHDPSRAFRPADAEAAATMAANQQALRVYAGVPFMHDPTLRARLPHLSLPTLVLWGESDRIVTPTYGQQFGALIPSARFKIIEEAGHFPQIEQRARVLATITGNPA